LLKEILHAPIHRLDTRSTRQRPRAAVTAKTGRESVDGTKRTATTPEQK
jgi:hypothetical protein